MLTRKELDEFVKMQAKRIAGAQQRFSLSKFFGVGSKILNLDERIEKVEDVFVDVAKRGVLNINKELIEHLKSVNESIFFISDIKLLCDYSLANKLFGWEPKVFIDEGLRRNIEWTKANLT